MKKPFRARRRIAAAPGSRMVREELLGTVITDRAFPAAAEPRHRTASDMSSQLQLLAINVSFWIVLLAPPLLVLFWRLPRGTTRISWRRFIASIACDWLLLNLHRWFIELPVLSARFAERHRIDPGYFWDPTSGNVTTFLLFWIPALLVTTIYSSAALVWWRFRKRDA